MLRGIQIGISAGRTTTAAPHLPASARTLVTTSASTAALAHRGVARGLAVAKLAVAPRLSRSRCSATAPAATPAPPPSPPPKENNKHSRKMAPDLMAAGSLRSQLYKLFAQALEKAYPDVNEEPAIAPCAQAKFGDYQCNNAMALFGKLKGKEGAPKAPRDVANALLAALPANDLIVETSLAGPGFINIKLSRPELATRTASIVTKGGWVVQQVWEQCPDAVARVGSLSQAQGLCMGRWQRSGCRSEAAAAYQLPQEVQRDTHARCTAHTSFSAGPFRSSSLIPRAVAPCLHCRAAAICPRPEQQEGGGRLLLPQCGQGDARGAPALNHHR
jgi:hypothetical protein